MCLGLGLHPGTQHASRPRIAVICESGSRFLHQIEQQLRTVIADYRQLHFTLDSVPNVQLNADRFSQLITRRAAECQGMILLCRDEVKINRAVQAATDNGIPIICLTSDLPNSRRTAYVGVDQTASGATAGWFMGRLLLENGVMDLVLGHDLRREIELCLALIQQPGSSQPINDIKTPLLTWHRYSYFA